MRTRRIRLDSNTGTSPRERDSGAPMGCRGARGQRTPDAAHAGMCHIQFNAAGPRTEQGDAPHGGGGGRPWASWQAACPRLERGGLQRRHARRNKAGRRNPAAPGGFRRRRSGARRRRAPDQLRAGPKGTNFEQNRQAIAPESRRTEAGRFPTAAPAHPDAGRGWKGEYAPQAACLPGRGQCARDPPSRRAGEGSGAGGAPRRPVARALVAARRWQGVLFPPSGLRRRPENSNWPLKRPQVGGKGVVVAAY